LDSIKIEGFVQLLKKEVEALSNMTRCMDAFINSNTRLVIIVDGLDSCEQDKLLQVLDMVCTSFMSF
jgi:ankyrin repeat-rich membrane spanning protein